LYRGTSRGRKITSHSSENRRKSPRVIAALLKIVETRHIHNPTEKKHALMFALKNVGECLNDIKKREEYFLPNHLGLISSVIAVRNLLTHHYDHKIDGHILNDCCKVIGKTLQNLFNRELPEFDKQIGIFFSNIEKIKKYFPRHDIHEIDEGTGLITQYYKDDEKDLVFGEECFAINVMFSLLLDLESFTKDQDLTKIAKNHIKLLAIQNCVSTLIVLSTVDRRKVLFLFEEINARFLSNARERRNNAVHANYEFGIEVLIELVSFFLKTAKLHIHCDLAALYSMKPSYSWHSSAKFESLKFLKDMEKYDDVQKIVIELTKQAEKLNAENGSISHTLIGLQSDLFKSEAENKKLNATVQNQNNALNRFKTLEENNSKLEDEHAKLKIKHEGIVKENGNLKNRNNNLSKELGDEKQKGADRDAKIKEYDVKIKAQHGEITKVKNEKSALEKDKNKQISEKDALLRTKNDEIKKIKLEKSQLLEENGKLQKVVSATQQENNRLRQEKTADQDKILGLEGKISVVDEENAQLVATIDKREDLIEAQREKIEVLQDHLSEIEQLREQLRLLTASNLQKDEQIRQLKHQDKKDGKQHQKKYKSEEAKAALSFVQKENTAPLQSLRQWNKKPEIVDLKLYQTSQAQNRVRATSC
jgi:FtsZ-binding cell division protein ZapB